GTKSRPACPPWPHPSAASHKLRRSAASRRASSSYSTDRWRSAAPIRCGQPPRATSACAWTPPSYPPPPPPSPPYHSPPTPPPGRLGELVAVFLTVRPVTDASTPDQAARDPSISGMAKQIERAPHDANLSLARDGGIESTSAQAGLAVDIAASRDQVTSALNT